MTSEKYIESRLKYLKRYEPSLSFDIDMHENILIELQLLQGFKDNHHFMEKRNIELKEENDKLKKVIDSIKELPNCDICDSNWHKGCMCLQNKLKEVLGSEK